MTELAKVTRGAHLAKPQPKLIFLMGLPGAGKGTQALNVVQVWPDHFIHFDTGEEIKKRVTDKKYAEDPEIQKQKEIHFAGILNDPAWVTQLVAERVRVYAGEGKSIVFSGSPRTLKEATDLLPVFEEGYSLAKLGAIILEVSEETARKRSQNRLVCPNCSFPTTKEMLGKHCPDCGQTLPAELPEDQQYKIDKLDRRFQEYYERTQPAIDYLRRFIWMGKINGEQSKEEVSRLVLSKVSLI